jgi:hypothetical protein
VPSAKHQLANATARTRSVIEDLQARLTRDAPTAPPPPEPRESLEDLERELEAYFERASPDPSRNQSLDQLRSRVIDGVVEKILAEWATSKPDTPQGLGFGHEVMDRLIERVLEEFRKTA